LKNVFTSRLMANNQEVVEIDLDIINTSRTTMALNLELLRNTLNEDTISVISSFIYKKEYIEGIEKKTRELYTPILKSIGYGREFQVGKIYYMFAYYGQYKECYCFQVQKITKCYITIAEIVNDSIVSTEVCGYSGIVMRKKINRDKDCIGFRLNKKISNGDGNPLMIVASNCVEIDKLSHLNYYYRNCCGGYSEEQLTINLRGYILYDWYDIAELDFNELPN